MMRLRGGQFLCVGVLLALVSMPVAAFAEVNVEGTQTVSVSDDSPSCGVMNYRMMYLDKEFAEWKVLSDKVVAKPSDNNRKDLSSLLNRIQGMASIASDSDVEVSVTWTLPEALAISPKNLVVGVQTPRHNWLSPVDQLLPDFHFTVSGLMVTLKINLSSLEYCLGNSQLVVVLGTGWASPFQEMGAVTYTLTADLTEFRDKLWMFEERGQ